MWLKRTKNIFTILGLISFATISLFIAITFLYEEEIKKQAIEELNNHLSSKVEVDEIELTALEQFPNIALKFSNIRIKDQHSITKQDTLLFSKRLYLNFNFLDVLKGNYLVKKIVFDKAVLNLGVLEKGQENYKIWINTSNSDGGVEFSLEKVVFNSLALTYSNVLSKQFYDFYSDNLVLKGDFYKTEYILNIGGDVGVIDFISNEVKYLENKRASLDLNLLIDMTKMNYKFNNGNVFIEGMPFNISGNYNVNQSFIDLTIVGTSIQIGQVFNVFPVDFLTVLQAYRAKGRFEFEASVIGELSKDKTPYFSANFSVINGGIVEQNSKTELSKINLIGSFSGANNQQREWIELSSFEAHLGNEKCSGSLRISNFSEPHVELQLSSNFPADQLTAFANVSIGESKGFIATDLNTRFKYNSGLDSYEIETIEGNFSLVDCLLNNPSKHLLFEDVNGTFSTSNGQLFCPNLIGKFNASPFNAQLELKNFRQLVTSSAKIPILMGRVEIGDLNFDDFTSSEDEDSSMFEIDESVNLNFDVGIKKAKYDKFRAKNINVNLSIKEGNITFNELSFKANKGFYLVDGKILKTDSVNYYFNILGNAQTIDISNFFSEFENFGQDYITEKNLKGRASINFKLAFPFSKSFTIDYNSISSNLDVQIKKGELIDHESVLEIKDYLNSSKLAKAFVDTKRLTKNLDHIHFSELSNIISIKDGKIYIPKMQIRSNVLDFSLSGLHQFNDSIDYKLSFRLKDVLKRNKKTVQGIEVKDEDVGKVLFLRMFGTTENPLFEMDKKNKKEQRKEAQIQEKEEIKSILNKELGLFNQDTSINFETKKDSTVFELEWEESVGEEDSSKINLKKSKQDTSKTKNKKLNKWLKKIGVDQEEKEKVIFEIDQ